MFQALLKINFYILFIFIYIILSLLLAFLETSTLTGQISQAFIISSCSSTIFYLENHIKI